MKIEWVGPDIDGDWVLHVDGDYKGLLATRKEHAGTWIFVVQGVSSSLDTTYIEEAKNTAFAMWALTQ